MSQIKKKNAQYKKKKIVKNKDKKHINYNCNKYKIVFISQSKINNNLKFLQL